MIFLTTGTQLPFDRLVRAVDGWLDGMTHRHEVCAQVLRPQQDAYVPRHFETVSQLSPTEYAEALRRADLIVSHAGMGSILTALTEGKRICIMPRKMRYGEHRNDHQLSTVQRLRAHPGLFTARDEHELPGCLDAALQSDWTARKVSVSPFADQGFTEQLRDFILTGQYRGGSSLSQNGRAATTLQPSPPGNRPDAFPKRGGRPSPSTSRD